MTYHSSHYNHIKWFLCIFFAGGNLSHQLSTCSAVSLPSKIDNICSDNELGDADDQDYEIDDEDNDDYDDGFTAYDDEDYNSDGDSGARSTAEVLNDNTENLPSQNHIYINGRKSPNRKLGQRYMFIKSNIDTKVLLWAKLWNFKYSIFYYRVGKQLECVSSNGAPNQRRRNKVKRRKAYYSRQRRTDIAVRIKIFGYQLKQKVKNMNEFCS